jgi:DNA-binding NarL/FixJ family response regulator
MISYSEKQLMQLVVAGANDEQIACCLSLSTKEVRLRIDDLMKRLGLTGRTELIRDRIQARLPDEVRTAVALIWRLRGRVAGS